MKLKALAVAACAALVTAGVAVAAPANATTVPHSISPSGSYLVAGHTLRAGDTLAIPAASLNPTAQGTVTLSVVPGTDLARTGAAAPGTHFAASVVVVTGTTLRPTASAASHVAASHVAVHPDSANGCTPFLSIYATCIDVTGSGLHVSAWETDAFYGDVNNICDVQFIWPGGWIYEEHYYGCGNGPARYEDWSYTTPFNLPGNGPLCNIWVGSWGGEPCIGVHA
jgi:hypothetical protein